MTTLLERVQASNNKIKQYLTLLESSQFTLTDGAIVNIVDGRAISNDVVLPAGKYPVSEDKWIEVSTDGLVTSIPVFVPNEPVTDVVETPETPEVPQPVDQSELVLEMSAKITELEKIIESMNTEKALFLSEIEKSEALISKLTSKSPEVSKIKADTKLSTERIEIKPEVKKDVKSDDYFSKQLDKVFL